AEVEVRQSDFGQHIGVARGTRWKDAESAGAGHKPKRIQTDETVRRNAVVNRSAEDAHVDFVNRQGAPTERVVECEDLSRGVGERVEAGERGVERIIEIRVVEMVITRPPACQAVVIVDPLTDLVILGIDPLAGIGEGAGSRVEIAKWNVRTQLVS